MEATLFFCDFDLNSAPAFELRKEIDLINNVQHLLRKTIDEAEAQIK